MSWGEFILKPSCELTKTFLTHSSASSAPQEEQELVEGLFDPATPPHRVLRGGGKSLTRVRTGLKIAAFFFSFFLTSYLKQHSANTSATVPKQRLTAIHLFQVNVSLFLSQGQQSTARTFKCHTCELRAAAQRRVCVPVYHFCSVSNTITHYGIQFQHFVEFRLGS